MSTANPSLEPPPFWEGPDAAEKPIDLLRFLEVFTSRWPFLVTLSLTGLLLGLGLTFLLRPRFTAQAVFLPPAQQRSAVDNPLALLIKAPSSSVYTGLLASDSVLGDVVRSAGLAEKFKSKDLPDARATLKGMTEVNAGTDDFVTVKVTSRDPRLAQQIASEYLRALTRIERRLAVDQASEQRLQFQSQLDDEKAALEQAETGLERAQESSGVVLPQNQTLSGLSAIDVTRASIRANQVALATLLQSRTERAPEVVRLRSEIAAQQTQLGTLESKSTSGPGSSLNAAQAPAVNLKFVQLEREVKYHQVLFDVMVREFQTAKMQEGTNAPGVQIVDYPELPLRRSWPSRRSFCVLGALLGLLAGIVLVFTQNRLRLLHADPQRARSLESLRSSFRAATLRP